MAALIGLLVLTILLLPLILSIVALIRTNRSQDELNSLRREIARMAAATPTPPAAQKPIDVTASPPEPVIAPPRLDRPTPPPLPPSPPVNPTPSLVVDAPPAAVQPDRKPRSTEWAVGGRWASFAGIGLLLTGIAFLVGYAIKNAWLGPEARVVLGLVSGALLVGLGHAAEIRGQGRLALLARALTGGGAALFYFCVFAAFGIYHIISAPLAAAGLVCCAAAALGLAIAYRSQAVAIIGVIGAFLMPPLIGRESPNLLFLLSYIAVINAPVIALGVARNWQALYNASFAFTALYLLGQVAGFERADAGWLLAFSALYFLQFAALGLLKLRAERTVSARHLDVFRLLLNSGGWLGVCYVVLDRMGWNAWTGAAFLIAAVVHLVLVRAGWTWRPSFTHDQLALLVGALTAASLALPLQLDGAWVSLGWSIEGAILCWFGLRANISLLRLAAFGLGLFGLMKTVVFDVQFYETAPRLFLNARFISGMLAAALLGVQAALHARQAAREPATNNDLWTLLPLLTVLGTLLVTTTDIFWTLGERHAWAWILSSAFLLIVGVTTALMLNDLPFMKSFGRILLIAVPVKLMLDALVIADLIPATLRGTFFNPHFAAFMAMSAVVLFGAPRWLSARAAPLLDGAPRFDVALNMTALFSAIAIVSVEIYRLPNSWNQPLITLWWAACAIALVAAGMLRHRRPLRYAGLWLFGAMTVKVLLVDLAGLDGLERIAAFIGAGVLLLVLSFIYQRASSRLAEEEAAP